MTLILAVLQVVGPSLRWQEISNQKGNPHSHLESGTGNVALSYSNEVIAIGAFVETPDRLHDKRFFPPIDHDHDTGNIPRSSLYTRSVIWVVCRL